MDWRRGAFDDSSSLPCKAAYMIAWKTWLDFWCKIMWGAGIARYWRTDWHCTFSHLADDICPTIEIFGSMRGICFFWSADITKYDIFWYMIVSYGIIGYRDGNHVPSFHIISAEIIKHLDELRHQLFLSWIPQLCKPWKPFRRRTLDPSVRVNARVHTDRLIKFLYQRDALSDTWRWYWVMVVATVWVCLI